MAVHEHAKKWPGPAILFIEGQKKCVFEVQRAVWRAKYSTWVDGFFDCSWNLISVTVTTSVENSNDRKAFKSLFDVLHSSTGQ